MDHGIRTITLISTKRPEPLLEIYIYQPNDETLVPDSAISDQFLYHYQL
tara:strand:+ start:431 stop:577 length:147 start_codon:yes stop_codon:yes gene_type:complete